MLKSKLHCIDQPLFYKEKTMKKAFYLLLVLCITLTITSVAQARNTKYLMSINEALKSPDSEEKLGDSVKFYFAGQPHPSVQQKMGTYIANRKTNAIGKKDSFACNWVFLSAMKSLETRAHQLGANAVINIVSYYDKNPMASPTVFECHAGATVAAVVLKGDFVKVTR